MDINEIPANEVILMTEQFHRVFNAANCNPMCHCCKKMIPVGDSFKLATIWYSDKMWGESVYFTKEILMGNMKPTVRNYLKIFNKNIREKYKSFDTQKYKEAVQEYKLHEREVMLCDACTSESYKAKLIEKCNAEISRMTAPRHGGCFRVNGQIVL